MKNNKLYSVFRDQITRLFMRILFDTSGVWLENVSYGCMIFWRQSIFVSNYHRAALTAFLQELRLFSTL